MADGFVQALCKPDEDVEALVAIHTDDCEVSNVSLPGAFRGHEGLREFWTSYRSTFGEMRSEFRNAFATEEGRRWSEASSPFEVPCVVPMTA